MSLKLGIICGMASEKRALGRWAEDERVAVAISGARPDRAEAEARRLISEGAVALLSWGIAGGLVPSLATGDIIRPGIVTGPDGQRRPVTLCSGHGVIAGYDKLVRHPAAKAGLRAATGAVAVDMESHRVALVATEAGRPFAVVRAISDTAETELPALVETALGEDGRPRIGKVFLGLARRPLDLPNLLKAGQESAAALAGIASIADQVIAELLSDQNFL